MLMNRCSALERSDDISTHHINHLPVCFPDSFPAADSQRVACRCCLAASCCILLRQTWRRAGATWMQPSKSMKTWPFLWLQTRLMLKPPRQITLLSLCFPIPKIVSFLPMGHAELVGTCCFARIQSSCGVCFVKTLTQCPSLVVCLAQCSHAPTAGNCGSESPAIGPPHENLV